MKTTPIIILAAASSLAAQAQQLADTTITQSLTIERAYSPVFKEANKIDLQPEIEQVQVTHTKATFADAKSQSVRPDEITDMNVGQVIVTPGATESGYLDATIGNYLNTDIKAGFHKGEFAVDATGFFTKGDLKTPFPQLLTMEESASSSYADLSNPKCTWKSLLGKGAITGSYEHHLSNNNKIEAKAFVQGGFADGTNFSLQTLERVNQETEEKSYDIYLQNEEAQRQHWGRFGMDAEYIADRYDVKVGYEHVGIKFPDNYENVIGVSGNLLAYRDDQWMATAAVKSEIIFGKEGNHFTFKPEVELSYMPDALSWRRVYAKWGLGSRRESAYELMEKVPLIYMNEYENCFDALDLTFGWEDSEMGWLKYGVSANMRYTKNDVNALMTSNNTYFEEMLDATSAVVLADPNETAMNGTYALLVNEDCFSFDLEAHLDYEFNRYFGAKAQLLYHTENCKLNGFGNPNFVTNLHLLGNVNKFKMDLSFEGAFKRDMSMLSIDPFEAHAFEVKVLEYDLDNIANLNFRLDYQHKKNLSFYAFANNLLNHKYQLWTAVPAQGINIHAGFNWKF